MFPGPPKPIKQNCSSILISLIMQSKRLTVMSTSGAFNKAEAVNRISVLERMKIVIALVVAGKDTSNLIREYCVLVV